jgi:hypothetical protein
MPQSFSGENMKETDHFKNLSVHVIILKWILKKRDKGVDWNQLA